MSTKSRVLESLLCAGDQFCSGGKLAAQCGVSRTAIWKAIEQLKAEGCEIEAVTNRGYRFRVMPDLYSEGYLRRLLEATGKSWNVRHYEEVGSTNQVAKELAANGAPSGTIVIADSQSGGRGRSGKQFHSPKGGLYVSYVLRRDMPMDQMMAVTACAAAAVHDALASFGVRTLIKWVNDLYIGDRKLCGILSEGSFSAELSSMEYLVIGIGINLHPDPDLPEALHPIVTDAETETGVCINRCALVARLTQSLDTYLDGIGEHTFLPVYTVHSYTIGKMVRVRVDGEERIGRAVGIASDAGLIVRLDDNTNRTIRTGTAEIVRSGIL
ncbi:MAG: biotin--[Oscillospiraceae bacterium]|nr:biotin--[acetyl-CoA-carboxylase] ligase [Oscillospiraceae bacterium]